MIAHSRENKMLYIYILLIIIFVYDIYIGAKFFEYVYCVNIKHQPPLVASASCLRQATVEQIVKYYNKSKNICEIGSGFGGLARAVAKQTKANVYALENMPFSAFVSKLCDLLSGCKNNHTIWGDAFKFLDKTNKKFDVAIAYLGPTLTPNIQQYKSKIRVLISLDFEIKGLKPVRIIDMSKNGCTVYNKIEYSHKLFVYNLTDM